MSRLFFYFIFTISGRKQIKVVRFKVLEWNKQTIALIGGHMCKQIIIYLVGFIFDFIAPFDGRYGERG